MLLWHGLGAILAARLIRRSFFLVMLYSTENPFSQPFERLGDKPLVTTNSVNLNELNQLVDVLTGPSRRGGGLVLLKSPRAGFGKTHLLERLRQRVVRTHEFIPLEPIGGHELDARGVLDAVIRRFSRVASHTGGLTILDFLARRIFALGLEPLVKTGAVPSDDLDDALELLRARPVEAFNFHDEGAVTAQWAMANFEALRPQLTVELCKKTRGDARNVSWWVQCLFDYSSTPVGQAGRNKALFDGAVAGGRVAVDAHEKLVALIKLISAVANPVFVLDEVEGYFGNPEAALQTCSLLNSLHQTCSKLTVIVSVNSDVWETAFAPRLSGGLKDRLMDSMVELKPLSQSQVKELLGDRVGDEVGQLVDGLDLDVGVLYARGVMKRSLPIWSDMVAERQNLEPGILQTEAEEPISLVTPDFSKSKKTPLPTSVGRVDGHVVKGEKVKGGAGEATLMMKKVIDAKLGVSIAKSDVSADDSES